MLEMSEDTLLSVLSGQQDARTALLAGKIKVHGDLSVATRFGQAGLVGATAEPSHERRT
jgi:putative sterol carrier protein